MPDVRGTMGFTSAVNPPFPSFASGPSSSPVQLARCRCPKDPPARLFKLGARSRWTTLTVIWAIQNKIALGTDEEKALELKREIAGGQERCCRMPISRCRRRSSSSPTRRPHASRVRFRRGTPTPPARVDAGFNRSSTRHSQHRPGWRQDGHTITARLGFTEVRGHDAALRPNPSLYNCRFYRFS
jgi:hypothetical protein